MSHPTSVLLINDNSAHLNWGAQATPPALKKVIESGLPAHAIETIPHEWLTRSYRRFPAGIRAMPWGDRIWRGLRPILSRLSLPVDFFPQVADDFAYWAGEWASGRGGPPAQEFLELAQQVDVVVYNGENSIYRNTPEGCRGLFLLWLSKTVLGKPSCIVNHTANLNEIRPIMNGMVKLVYPILDVVAAREPASLENLKAMGIGNGELYADVVFALEPPAHAEQRVTDWRRSNGLETDQSYFCLSASGLPASMPRDTWDGEVAGLVRSLKSSGLQAVLVAKDPWCLPLEEVARRTDSLFFGPDHEFQHLWPLFSGASFLVSGHYHYVIFASMVGCPFIPLSVNNHKMRGVCEHLEWGRTTPFDITSLAACRQDLVREAETIKRERAALSRHLKERSAVLGHGLKELGARIAGVTSRIPLDQGPTPTVDQ